MPRLAYLYIYLFNTEPLSEEPLVRCLFINIFCNLGPRLAYLFIYLFNIEPLSAEPLSASIPLRALYILLLFLLLFCYLSVQESCGTFRTIEGCNLKTNDFEI